MLGGNVPQHSYTVRTDTQISSPQSRRLQQAKANPTERRRKKSPHNSPTRLGRCSVCACSARSQFPLPRWRAANVSQQPNRSASAPPSVVHKPASSFIHNRVDQLRAGAVASAPKARHRLVRSPNRAPSAASPSAPPWRTAPASHPLGTVRVCVRDGE